MTATGDGSAGETRRLHRPGYAAPEPAAPDTAAAGAANGANGAADDIEEVEVPLLRPVVQVIGGALPTVIDAAEQILIAGDNAIYAFGDQVVRPAMQPIRTFDKMMIKGLRLVPIALAHMIERFTRQVDFQKYNGTARKWVPIDCPRAVAEAYLQRCGLWRLPQLSALTTCPLLLPGGRILEQPGFDAESGVLFDPQGVAFPPVPAAPSADEGRDALDRLLAPFRDFPFVDAIARGVLVSALLSSVARMAMPFVPCHAFDAPAAGTGKSKLVECCSVLLTGREPAVVSQATEDAEFEKKLGAVLLAGDPLVAIDNCTEAIDHPLLCMVLTQPLVQIRILGFSKTATIPNHAMLFATGNNFRFAGDMLRRGFVGRLDAGVERPELRTFETEDPVKVLKRDRPRYVTAALTALRSYLHAGQPAPFYPQEGAPPEALAPLGGFEDWSRLVRDCLVWLGEADPVQTLETARSDDPELMQFEAVIAQWEGVIGHRRVSAKDIVSAAMRHEGLGISEDDYTNPELRQALLAVAGDDGRINTNRLGNWLSKRKNRVSAGRRIVGDGTLEGNFQWRLQHQRSKGWE